MRAVARSKSKADRMLKSRGQFSDLLEFHYIDDLTSEGIFDDSIQGIDGVIHAASVSGSLFLFLLSLYLSPILLFFLFI